ncbi:M20 family peptidase [Solimonas terrae]|uniref:M20/M25/M40 family metallo-hydrolase n=1 Tax=Solimonas terrae TaxID=1396819 RepID=A0A6M2BV15_9GAMM|nr:M20 family peptidase [Solimonas terrae]NGY06426.1 M20/M25/M40 family metallo-hydrolase [Solimonas terrae]
MRYLLILAVPVLLLGVALLLPTMQASTPASRAAPVAIAVDDAALAEHLAAAIRIATVSPTAELPNDAAFDAFAALLQTQYPRAHAALELDTVDKHGLLYRWPGSDAELAPVLLLAHQDVVPVEAAALPRWQHAPFSGDVSDGYIWGRGTLDNKGNLIAQLEAVEALLAQGYAPRRTLYFAYGYDEETGGVHGASEIAAVLEQRGVHALFGVDEGGAITQGVIKAVRAPIASIMTAEKGYVSFELLAHAAGGHSSMPPKVTAIGELARAITQLEAAPMPARLTAPVSGMLDALAPSLPFAQRLAIANRWLFATVLLHQLAQAPVTNALVRTTTAPTIFDAGVKDNVLPGEARAVVNFRLLPGDTIADVRAHVIAAINDPAITVRNDPQLSEEASPDEDAGGPGFAILRKTVEQIFPDAIVVPGLVVGATDLRHYADVMDARYNFTPGRLQADDLERIHGVDERVSVDEFANMVRFYRQLLQNVSAP